MDEENPWPGAHSAARSRYLRSGIAATQCEAYKRRNKGEAADPKKTAGTEAQKAHQVALPQEQQRGGASPKSPRRPARNSEGQRPASGGHWRGVAGCLRGAGLLTALQARDTDGPSTGTRANCTGHGASDSTRGDKGGARKSPAAPAELLSEAPILILICHTRALGFSLLLGTSFHSINSYRLSPILGGLARRRPSFFLFSLFAASFQLPSLLGQPAFVFFAGSFSCRLLCGAVARRRRRRRRRLVS